MLPLTPPDVAPACDALKRCSESEVALLVATETPENQKSALDTTRNQLLPMRNQISLDQSHEEDHRRNSTAMTHVSLDSSREKSHSRRNGAAVTHALRRGNCSATAAAVTYFLPRRAARRRDETDAATPDLSKLGLLPLELIERSLAYLPLRFLSNSVKNVNPRYRELALPLLVRRVLWLERELSHDEFEAVAGDAFARRRPYFVELEQLCKTLQCATYIRPPPAELLES